MKEKDANVIIQGNVLTIFELYDLCDNLGPYTLFNIRRGRKLIMAGPYKEIAPQLLEEPVSGFRFLGQDAICVYLS